MRNCVLKEFKSYNDSRGSLVPIEGGKENKDIPFDIKRIYYIYNVPSDLERGFHSHLDLDQVLIAISGKVKIRCKDNKSEEIYHLDSPNKGLYIGSMIWREMFDFEDNAVLLVLASNYYDKEDYIMDYNNFLELSDKYFKNKDEINKYLTSNNLKLNFVDIPDAEFLHSLRSDKKLTQFISQTNGDVESQKKWITEYKIREYQNKELYFKITDHDNNELGFVRLYNIDHLNKKATFGSLIMVDGKPKLAAVEVLVMVMNIAFKYLKLDKVELDVRVENLRAKKLYNKFGFEKTREDELDEFYELTSEKFDDLYENGYSEYVRSLKYGK